MIDALMYGTMPASDADFPMSNIMRLSDCRRQMDSRIEKHESEVQNMLKHIYVASAPFMQVRRQQQYARCSTGKASPGSPRLKTPTLEMEPPVSASK